MKNLPIVLATGISRRMGVCKTSLVWGEGKTLLSYQKEMRSHLQKIREDTFGLRQVIHDFYPVITKVEFDEPAVLLDINTPEIYQQQFPP